MKRENVQAIYPLLPAQEAFLVAHRHSANDPGCLHASCRIRGSLDHDRFQQALNSLVERHELLRASIKLREGKSPLIIVWKRLDVAAELFDFSSESDPHEALLKWKTGFEEAVVDLEQPPAFDFALCRIGPEEHFLFWKFHHIFLDGWSTSVALRDLFELYEAVESPSQTPRALTTKYASYLAARKSAAGDRAEDHWKRSLDGYEGVTRTFGVTTAFGSQSAAPQIQERKVPPDVVQALNVIVRENQLTIGAAVSAAWSLTLSHLYGQTDVAFASTVSGRSLPVDGLQDTVGLFTNVVPVRVHCTTEQTAVELMKRLRDDQFESQPFELVPLEEIESGCRLRRDRVLLETLLVIENFPEAENNGQLQLDRFESGLTSGFPFTLVVIPGEEWIVKTFFDPSACAPELAGQLATGFVDAVQRFARAPESTNQQLIEGMPRLVQRAVESEQPTGHQGQVDTESQTFIPVGEGEPQTDTQLKLATIWESALGKPGIRIDDNFFELGGRSLTAVRLLSAVEERFGTAFTPKILVEHPTIEKLALLIESGDSGSGPETVIRFNDIEDGTPLVCVHCGGEQAMYYRHLAAYFPDRPAIGIQSKGFEDGKTFESFEAHASHSLKLVRSMFGDKPVHLVGYCAGATLAMEMAAQREAVGDKIASFIVVDSPVMWPQARRFEMLRNKHGSAVRAAAGLIAHNLRKTLRWARQLPRDLRDRWSGNAENRRRYFQKLVTSRTMKAFFAYQPKILKSPVLLLRSSDCESRKKTAYHLEWKDYTTGGFEVRIIEAGHETILLEPEVERVAREIHQVIDGRS
ncbi:MAG: alpha/beta fold hydrolase [Planctomycetota bacterium]